MAKSVSPKIKPPKAPKGSGSIKDTANMTSFVPKMPKVKVKSFVPKMPKMPFGKIK